MGLVILIHVVKHGKANEVHQYPIDQILLSNPFIGGLWHWLFHVQTRPFSSPRHFLTSTRSTGDICTSGEISCSIKHMLQKQLRSHPAAEDADSDGPNLKNLQMSFADHQANP